MSIVAVVGAVKPLAQALLKVLELIDPKTRDWVRKRKALEFAEKYIFANEEARVLNRKAELTKKEMRKLADLNKKLRYYRKWFFDYN